MQDRNANLGWCCNNGTNKLEEQSCDGNFSFMMLKWMCMKQKCGGGNIIFGGLTSPDY